jgi:hypothetical protein
MGRHAPTFELLPRQRAILERLNRQRTVERRLAERVQVVLWSAAGKPSVVQAAALGVDPQRILRWRHRWADENARLADAERCEETTDEKLEALIVEVLSDEERSGSPGKLSAEQLAQIVSLACEDPAELGLPITHWTPRELALEAERRGIVPSISARHIARFFGGSRSAPASLATGSTPRSKTRYSTPSRWRRSVTYMPRRRRLRLRGRTSCRATRRRASRRWSERHRRCQRAPARTSAVSSSTFGTARCA